MSKKSRKNHKTQAAPTDIAIKKKSLIDLSSRKWVIALVMGATFLAFANTLSHGFAYDDKTQILQNQVIRSFSNLPIALTKEVWFWRVLQNKDPNTEEGPTTAYYRPMFTVYLMACWQLFTDDPVGWHFANIFVHMLAVFFAFLVLEKISKDLRVAAIGALLFAVHPLRSESVAWISGVTDPFLAVFLLSSFYFYMRHREEGGMKFLWVALGLFLIAAFSKEPAIALPIFIFAYELFVINQDKPLRKRDKTAALYGASFLAASIAYFAMRYQALGFVLSDDKFTDYSGAHVLLTIPLVIFKYLGLLLWPVNLTLFHGTPLVKSPLSLRFILPALGLLAFAFILWRLRRQILQSATAKFALLWFSIHLLPVLNLNAFSEDFMVQERYVYVPSIGFSLLIAMGLAKLPLDKWLPLRNRRVAQATAAGLVVVALSGITLAQNNMWKDDETLWVEAAARVENQPMAHFIVGHYMLKWQRPDRMVEELEKYVKIIPDNKIALSNLAAAHLTMYERTLDSAHVDRAMFLAEKGLALDGENAALLDTLGRCYTFDTPHRNYNRALVFFNRAMNLQPNNVIFAFHIGATYVKSGDYNNAIRYLEPVVKFQPDYFDTYKFLAAAYEGRGQYKEAIDYLNRYLQFQPNAPDAPRQAQNLEILRAKLKEQEAKS
ncbi:MAG TPA: tetratricopeptide repeat protein [Blastocatellia bacterium]|nr:tetratricopeptide repeat protein [Blastocatellia bacterium]